MNKYAVARELRRKACWNKKHSTVGSAEAQLRSLLRLEPEGKFETYWCGQCQAFHVGHRIKKNPR